jgi:hypothetical protein
MAFMKTENGYVENGSWLGKLKTENTDSHFPNSYFPFSDYLSSIA